MVMLQQKFDGNVNGQSTTMTQQKFYAFP